MALSEPGHGVNLLAPDAGLSPSRTIGAILRFGVRPIPML